LPEPDPLDPLREEFPRWTFSWAWSGATSGPGCTTYRASRDGVTVTSQQPAGLAEQITRLERHFYW